MNMNSSVNYRIFVPQNIWIRYRNIRIPLSAPNKNDLCLKLSNLVLNKILYLFTLQSLRNIILNYMLIIKMLSLWRTSHVLRLIKMYCTLHSQNVISVLYFMCRIINIRLLKSQQWYSSSSPNETKCN